MNINEYQGNPWGNHAKRPAIVEAVTKSTSIPKPIALKPIAFMALFIVVSLVAVIQHLLIVDLKSRRPDRMFYQYKDSIYMLNREKPEYKTIDELFADLKIHQSSREYWRIIDILRHGDIDKLVAAEFATPNPRVIVIYAEGATAYGIEDHRYMFNNYKMLGFPGTSDTISDPGYDFWIMWAIDFTRRYNIKFESEAKKARR